ncbi:unnamed protein product [Acanthoscelides obtectus]|uniref:PiggyBac transposable element-derived protein domain-containing protein n=1 Tax=Acanthoscelides obtectus TaxID=200917 RepID=A0A9P0KR36_ACAOB|nr:unnamed protein product [Acanthoscelides obtectus]CAK1635889.1 PiggyBac transposable element-derived protein 4 [Acanthoscelides obtectus]
MSRNRALTQKELEEEIERIMQNLSDEASALEDDNDSIADSNYEPIDDESSDSSDTNSTASLMLAQIADTNYDELSVTSGTNSPSPGSSAASAPMPNTDTDDNLAGNAGAASDNMIWSIPTGRQPVLLNFTKQTGTEPHLAELLREEPLEMFYFLLINDSIFQYIADQTNLYATQVITDEADVKGTSTDKNEIKKVFGLLSYMGIVKMHNIQAYWSREAMYKNSMASKVMTRNRFELLLRMLHFADNQDNPDNDRLHKIQPLIDKIVHNFKTSYEPSETCCIDESLIPFRGRLIMQQYIRNKRHKYGIKVFKLCSKGGYTYNFKIYAGKNLDQGHTTPTSVVMSLFEPILDSGRTLVTDNWYTSVDLAKRLMDRQTYLMGTLRKNRRGLQKDQVNKKLKCGEIAALENQDGVTVISWNDKRNVLVLSTKHSNTTVDTTNRRQKTVKKPEAIVAYNAGKSSVDISDQMTAHQTPLRRTFKWYRKLAVEIILNTAMVNAWIMYKETVNARISLLQFRKAVTYKLCQAQDDGLAEQPDAEMIPKRKRQKHEMGKSDYKKRRLCSRCYEKARAEKGWKEARELTRGRYYCKGCNGEPFFCLSCFNKFHRYETP